MNKFISIILSIALMVSILAQQVGAGDTGAFHDDSYGSLPIVISSTGENTLIDALVRNQFLYVNAAQLGDILGLTFRTTEKHVGLRSEENNKNVMFSLTKNIAYSQISTEIATYKTPCTSIHLDDKYWIPFQFALKILDCGVPTIENRCISIDLPHKTVSSSLTTISKNLDRYFFDVSDVGAGTGSVVSAYWVNYFNQLLDFDLFSLEELAVWRANTIVYREHGQDFTELMVADSQAEVSDIIEQERVFDELANSGKDVAELLMLAAKHKGMLELEKAADFFSELNEQVNSALGTGLNALEIVSYGLEIAEYYEVFSSQDKYSLEAMDEFLNYTSARDGALSNDAVNGMQSSVNQFKRNGFEYSMGKFISENSVELLTKAIEKPADLAIAQLIWSMASTYIPILKDSLDGCDALYTSLFATMIESESYQFMKDMRQQSSDSDFEDSTLDELSSACYVYLKSCYVARETGIKSLAGVMHTLNDENTELVTSYLTELQNINEEISQIMVLMRYAGTSTSEADREYWYGFLPSDNQEYLDSYDDSKLIALIGVNPEQLTNHSDYVGQWTVDIDKTQDGQDSLQSAFGSGISYGYQLTLGEDGSISWGIGIGNGGEGTWQSDGDSIQATYTTYETGQQETMELVVLQEGGQTWLVQDFWGYYVYWVKQESTLDITDYYWYLNIQCWEIYSFENDGTFNIYYTDMPLSQPSENTVLAVEDLTQGLAENRTYSFDGKTLTLFRDGYDTVVLDLYNKELCPAEIADPTASSAIAEYDGSTYFYQTDWTPDPGLLSDNATYLVRLGKKDEANGTTLSGEDDLKNILENTTSDTIANWFYADFDGDGTCEAYAVTEQRENDYLWSASVWFISSNGKVEKALSNANMGEVFGPQTMRVGTHTFLMFASTDSGTMYMQRTYIFGVKDGESYQPRISGEIGLFQSTDWDSEIIPADAPSNAYFHAEYVQSMMVNGDIGNIIPAHWDNFEYYRFNESTLEFTPIEEEPATASQGISSDLLSYLGEDIYAFADAYGSLSKTEYPDGSIEFSDGDIIVSTLDSSANQIRYISCFHSDKHTINYVGCGMPVDVADAILTDWGWEQIELMTYRHMDKNAQLLLTADFDGYLIGVSVEAH